MRRHLKCCKAYLKLLYMRFFLLFFAAAFLLWACDVYRQLPDPEVQVGWKSKILPENPQDFSGDPDAGWNYMIYGGFIGSGFPYDFLEPRLGDFVDTVLARDGKNSRLPHAFNVFEAENGVALVSGNCLTCHASAFQGELVVGLGNSFSDFTDNVQFTARAANFLIRRKYRKGSPERIAYADFGKYYEAIGPSIVVPMRGPNPAFRLEEACMQHRNPDDLSYERKSRFDMMKYTLASDVPPLWNIRKKQALYYNGMGQGSFNKLLMQASVLGVVDSTQARSILAQFDDVVAWAAHLEPPVYPEPIDAELAALGETVFEEHCNKCHGSYGAVEEYPGKLIAIDQVKTDPYYALYFTEHSSLADWYNKSWFALQPPLSAMNPEPGYIAPPLDGIWATAPFLHNGSVPTLEALLNSALRPTYWARSGNSDDYDFRALGWNYRSLVKPDKKEPWLYNTSLPGYGNQGHYYGDKLSQSDRMALIEYLKTL